MSQRASAVRRRLQAALVAAVVLSAVVAVVAGVVAVVLHRAEGRKRAAEPLVTASAPPHAGARPPGVRLLGPGERMPRPQAQLGEWARGMSKELNIPRPALEAYGYAAADTGARYPRCRLTWTALAGIGSMESGHGRFKGARLDASGRPSQPIRGLPLDGSPGVRRVPDTDGGRVDGDPRWDRAVGPLQFLPATWRARGVDADGDGIANPNDMDDAAVSAARYLCETGGDLASPRGWWSALLTYNQSQQYGQDVLDRADRYGRLSALAS